MHALEHPLETNDRLRVAQALQAIIQPYFWRRTKQQILRSQHCAAAPVSISVGMLVVRVFSRVFEIFISRRGLESTYVVVRICWHVGGSNSRLFSRFRNPLYLFSVCILLVRVLVSCFRYPFALFVVTFLTPHLS
jgi:hypothetical protein